MLLSTRPISNHMSLLIKLLQLPSSDLRLLQPCSSIVNILANAVQPSTVQHSSCQTWGPTGTSATSTAATHHALSERRHSFHSSSSTWADVPQVNLNNDVKPHLVQQFLSQSTMSRQERAKIEKQQIVKQHQRHLTDVGSPEVTAAMWTYAIREHVSTLYTNKKNHVELRKVELLMNQRRRLLGVLREVNFDAYAACIHRLGLADVFGTRMVADRYPVGKAHADPAGAVDAVNRHRFAYHTEFKQKKTSQFKRLLPLLKAEDPNLPPPPASLIPGTVQRL